VKDVALIVIPAALILISLLLSTIIFVLPKYVISDENNDENSNFDDNALNHSMNVFKNNPNNAKFFN